MNFRGDFILSVFHILIYLDYVILSDYEVFHENQLLSITETSPQFSVHLVIKVIKYFLMTIHQF